MACHLIRSAALLLTGTVTAFAFNISVTDNLTDNLYLSAWSDDPVVRGQFDINAAVPNSSLGAISRATATFRFKDDGWDEGRYDNFGFTEWDVVGNEYWENTYSGEWTFDEETDIAKLNIGGLSYVGQTSYKVFDYPAVRTHRVTQYEGYILHETSVHTSQHSGIFGDFTISADLDPGALRDLREYGIIDFTLSALYNNWGSGDLYVVDGHLDVTFAEDVPEPGLVPLMVGGLVGIFGFGLRRRRHNR